MRSTGHLSMSDSRRLSPQTTSSSGYHSDLSSATSTNESPQSIHEILPTTSEKCSSTSSSYRHPKIMVMSTDAAHDKSSANKNLSRLSSFLRRQYERAKSRLTTNQPASKAHASQVPASSVTTCSKATSTTPLSHLSEDNYISTIKTRPKQQQQQQQQHQYAPSNQEPNYRPHYLSSVYKQSSFTEPVSE